MKFDHRVFQVEGGHYYIARNANYMPEVPQFDICMRPYMLLKQGRVTQWSSSAYPHLPFIIRNPSFTGPLFSRLAQGPFLFPIDKTGSGYSLAKHLQESWMRLELALVDATNRIYHAIPKDFIARGMSDEGYPLPCRFGYYNVHESVKKALQCAVQSRDAFLHLMARCTMIIAQHSHVTLQTPCLEPSWMKVLMDSGVSENWASLLQQSEVADLTVATQRVGVFFNPSNENSQLFIDTHVMLPVMEHAGVPIWMYMSEGRPTFAQNHVGHRYRMTEEDFKNATVICRNENLSGALFPSSHAEDRMDVCSTELQSHHSIISHDGQSDNLKVDNDNHPKPGEHWQSFFERRDKQNKSRMLNETDAERQQRLDREKYSESHQVPGKRGATVYCWERDDENDILTRQPVTRNRVPDIWRQYSNSQRRYDGFKDEWDLCVEFDPEFDPDECRYELDDIVFDFEGNNQPNYTTDIGQGPSNIFNLDKDMDHECLWSYRRKTECIFDVLLYRYSFDMSGQPPCFAQVSCTSDWSKRIKALGEIEVPTSDHQKIYIEHFLNCCLQKRPFASEFTAPQGGGNTIELVQLHNQVWYVIRGKDPELNGAELGWDLAVADPLTALECTRRPWTNTSALSKGLVLRGIPFTTRIRRRVKRIPSKWERPMELGWRTKGWIAGPEDYRSYASLRDDFLKKPRGRAALLKGGIVWRLALDTLHYDAALSGPSQEVFAYGNQIVLANGDAWWDDDLTVDELDLICGKYNISTGIASQTSDSSWWPKHSTWAKLFGQINHGYWSAHCEDWFQRRLESIRKGQASPRKASDWAQAFKWAKFPENVAVLQNEFAKEELKVGK